MVSFLKYFIEPCKVFFDEKDKQKYFGIAPKQELSLTEFLKCFDKAYSPLLSEDRQDAVVKSNPNAISTKISKFYIEPTDFNHSKENI